MGKHQIKNEESLRRIKLPEEGEVFGRVRKMLGGENIQVECTDNMVRRCRIRGKLKRRVWIRENDVVVVSPWEFDDSRGDIMWKYTIPQINDLKAKNKMPREV